MTETTHAAPWPLGDYPYCNGFLDLPLEGLTLPAHAPHGSMALRADASHAPADDAHAGHGAEGLPETAAPELFWFRWVTGHQMAFLYWQCLEAELRRAVANKEAPAVPPEHLAAPLANAGALTAGYSALLVYTGSLPRDLYGTTIRPFMHLVHQGFSGKWARGYRPIPALMKELLATKPAAKGQDRPAEAALAQLKRAYVENHQVHMAIAQKLVPDGASLRKQFQGEFSTEATITSVELDRFDYFFLVRRRPVTPHDLAAQLLQRHDLVQADIACRGVFPEAHCRAEVLPPALDGGDLTHYREHTGALLRAATRVALEVLSAAQDVPPLGMPHAPHTAVRTH